MVIKASLLSETSESKLLMNGKILLEEDVPQEKFCSDELDKGTLKYVPYGAVSSVRIRLTVIRWTQLFLSPNAAHI